MKVRILALLPSVLLVGCVSTNDLGVSRQDWQATSAQQQQQMKQAYRNIMHYQQQQMKPEPNKAGINVVLDSGTAMMPPFTSPLAFRIAKATIPAGECRQMPLDAITSDQTVDLTACYIHGVLALDPSHYQVNDWQGTRFINYNPLWLQGFTYHQVSTSGYVRLKHTDVTIKMDAA